VISGAENPNDIIILPHQNLWSEICMKLYEWLNYKSFERLKIIKDSQLHVKKEKTSNSFQRVQLVICIACYHNTIGVGNKPAFHSKPSMNCHNACSWRLDVDSPIGQVHNGTWEI
jgi:hypothetical protein